MGRDRMGGLRTWYLGALWMAYCTRQLSSWCAHVNRFNIYVLLIQNVLAYVVSCSLCLVFCSGESNSLFVFCC